MAQHSAGRIFISYRRDETAWPARTLYALLVETFGADQVFKDVDNIEPGDDFVERITEAVTACDVLLAMIGPHWSTMTDETGARRLDNPDDFVRIEIAVALNRGIRVVPILVDGARMPKASELPPDLVGLTRRQAVEINPVGFSTDRLLATMAETLSGVRAGKPVAEALTNALTKESATPPPPVEPAPAAEPAPPVAREKEPEPSSPVAVPAVAAPPVTPMAPTPTAMAASAPDTQPPAAWSSPAHTDKQAAPSRAWVPPTQPAPPPSQPPAWVPPTQPAQPAQPVIQPAARAWVPPTQPAWGAPGGPPPGGPPPVRPLMGPAQVPAAPQKSTGKILAIVGGVIASIVVILMVAASFAQPDNVITGPTASPSAVVTPEPSPEPSPGPSTPTTPKAGECSSELTSRQCRLAKDVGAFYILLESCVPNPDFADAVVCDPAGADAIKGDPTVYLFRETSRADLDKDIDQFFKHVNVKPGSDWLNPPAKTTWFYRTDPDTTIGTLASANDKADNQGRVAWTFNKELIYAEIASAGGDAKNLIEWWSR